MGVTYQYLTPYTYNGKKYTRGDKIVVTGKGWSSTNAADSNYASNYTSKTVYFYGFCQYNEDGTGWKNGAHPLMVVGSATSTSVLCYMNMSAITSGGTAVTSTYSFNANGGSGAPSAQTKTYGTHFTFPSTIPTRSGYIFAGWTNGTSGTTIYKAGTQYTGLPDSNTTFYAKWVAYTYFNLNYDSIPINFFSYNFLYGHTTNGMPSSAGITASIDHSTGIVTLNGTSTKSFDLGITLLGTRLSTSDTYHIRATYVSGSWSSTDSSAVGALGFDFRPQSTRQFLTCQFPTSSQPTWSGNITPNSTTVSEGGNALLHWCWHNGGYTFTNYKFRLSVTKSSNATFSPNAKFHTTDTTYGTLPTVSRTGYTFNGWYTDSSGGTKITSSSAFAGTDTLYAQWIPNTFTYSFDANGGSGSVSSSIKTYGVHFTFPTIIPSRQGYKFVGWTQGTAGTTVYSAGTQYVGLPDENITFYAKWTELTSDERKIYIYNDGSIEAAMFIESDSKFGFYNTGAVYAKSFVEGSDQFKITSDGKIYCKKIIERF